MKLDVTTLVVMLGIAYALQVIAFFLQYLINKSYKGIGWWVIGFLMLSLSLAAAPLRNFKFIEYTAITFHNIMLLLGLVSIYIGVIRFFDRKENWRLIISIIAGFIVSLIYFLYVNENLNARVVAISIVLSIVLFLTSWELFRYKTNTVKASANFNSAVIFIFGCFFLIRAAATIILGDLGSYFNPSLVMVSVFMVAFVEGILVTLGFIMMVNQRLNAEMKIAKEEVELIFNASPDGVLLTTLDSGIIKKINEGFTAITGFSRDEAIGKSTITINFWNDPSDRMMIIKRLIIDGIYENIEVDLKKKDGSLMTGMMSAKIVLINNIPHILSVTRDITWRKKEEEEKKNLEAQNLQLQKAESLRLMAGAIAHHFNNQLQSVIGNIELSILDKLEDEESSKILCEAIKSTEKAAGLSRLMLTYLGQANVEREPQDLSEICNSYLPMLQVSIPKDASFLTDIQSPGPVINTNSNEIQQILTNLVSNAIDAAGPEKNIIRLGVKTVSSEEIPKVHRYPIEWQPVQKEYACIELSDTGLGIDVQDIERVFDPFFSSKSAGRGLGLSAVLGIVRAHSGAITVKSKIGEGAVLNVYFPVSESQVRKKAEKTVSTQDIEWGGTVLLTDDEDSVRKIISATLKRFGFRVINAKDGIEALNFFKGNHKDIRLVILDLNMPHLDGWGAFNEIRKISPDVPVIFSSGYDESSAMAGDHKEMPQAYLSKPFEMKELRDTIRSVLAASKR